MIGFVWESPAEADLAAIDDYWWPLDLEIAVQLTDRIQAAAALLQSVPAGGATIDADGARKWRIAHAPYQLLCRTRANAVQIMRIHRDRQDWRPE